MVPEAERATFLGIVRADGRVGTRNYIGIALDGELLGHRRRTSIAEWFTPERLAEFPNVDGVVAFTHSTGCGMEMTGEPMDLLRRTLGRLRAPRQPGRGAGGRAWAASATSSSGLLEQREAHRPAPSLHTFVMQDTGGTRKTIEAGVAAVKELLPEANRVTRAAGSGEPHHRRPAVRRLGRLLLDHRQPGAGRRDGHPGAPRRHRRSCRRRRRSTASSTRSRGARSRARSARS